MGFTIFHPVDILKLSWILYMFRFLKNIDVHIDNLSTALLLIFQTFCIIITALQESVLYLIKVFEP